MSILLMKRRAKIVNTFGFPSFKKGGFLKKTGPIFAHAGEFVLPKGIKPTDAQRALIKKRSK